MTREEALFRARREALDTQIAVLRKQIRETGEEAKALAEQIAAEERALKLQKEELAANEALLAQGYVQKTRLLTLQRAVAEYEARHSERRAELSKSRQRASELEFRILAHAQHLRADRDRRAEGSDRADVRPRGAHPPVARRLRAPEDHRADRGRGGRPAHLHAGSVIGPREVLMEIVPKEKRLIVEARIRPEDINHVRAGIGGRHPPHRLPEPHHAAGAGAVTYVSGDRMVDQQTGAPYYMVHIDVPESALAASNLKLQAGMPAEVFIRTDTRTALDYLLAPVTSYLRRAMREPV